GITVSAGPSDVVTIRGLTLNGLGVTDGIVFTSGAALYVQDSVFKNLENGVIADTSASVNVVVEDSIFTGLDFGIGVFLRTTGGTIRGTIEHCRFEDGQYGVDADQNSKVVVRDSVASGNSSAGFYALTGRLDIENSLATQNNYGLQAEGGGMRVSQTTIE